MGNSCNTTRSSRERASLGRDGTNETISLMNAPNLGLPMDLLLPLHREALLLIE